MERKFLTVGWASGSNIYEVNVRQYTKEGTFNAFSLHLPRLKQMGVDILWFMPVTPISIKGRQGSLGSYYACSNYAAVNPEFGSIDDFKNLVNQAHELGMKVIIDWVANHTGWDHHWVNEHPEWYKKNEKGEFFDEHNWIDVIDLNFVVKEMREEMIRCMQFWVSECGIDGFRCDMAHLVPIDFWFEARTACEHSKKLFWLAECEAVEYHEVFDVSYGWEWMQVSRKLIQGEYGMDYVYQTLHKYLQYPAGSQKLLFTTNHDENSWNGTEYEKYGEAAKAFAVFSCTFPGIPLIYSGQEKPNKKRLLFFDKDEINWDGPLQLQGFYQKLLSLRKTNEAFQFETEIQIFDHENKNKVLAYLCYKNQSKVIVILNFLASERIIIDLQHELIKGDYINLFSGRPHHFESNLNIGLYPGEFVIYHTEK
ncbi:MAG: 1,4-alpha-glucan branching protein [Chitinophagaceae bacterium]|nr:1,4-alpha-glucan branching protein [Chitinophagaceae bacterium]